MVDSLSISGLAAGTALCFVLGSNNISTCLGLAMSSRAIRYRQAVMIAAVGLMAGAGGVHRLPRQIPLKIAMGMMLTGKHITAQEAAKWGIANEVVALKDLIPTAERWAHEIMECSPVSIQASKQAAMDGLGLSMEDANAKRFALSEKLWHSKDSIEGPLAFSQKRKPNWTGE